MSAKTSSTPDELPPSRTSKPPSEEQRDHVAFKPVGVLAPDIADGKFRLVIVTGNAGDGKTAFLQQLENMFARSGVEVETLPSKNGAIWLHGDLEYESNYDGSQDEGDLESDEVLAKFLAPFAGDDLRGLDGNAVRLIAINEGRLLDFLSHSKHSGHFVGLREFVHRALDAESDLPSRALLVNLNLRSLAAGGEKSLVERQLRAFVSDELWAPCTPCDHRHQCPLLANANTLRDPVSGPAVRTRIRRLFEVVHMRRLAHVTMRDLRSALSWLLLRDHDCSDVGALVVRNDAKATLRLADLSYTEAFADKGAVGRHGVDDRLVSMLRQADPGKVNAPQRDRLLDRDPGAAVPWMSFETRSPEPYKALQRITKEAARPGDDVSLAKLLDERRALIERWRRCAFFERRDEEWKEMVPYRSLRLLEEGLHTDAPEKAALARTRLRDEVVQAVSLSEGLRHPELLQRYLALRVSHIKQPSIFTYRLFPKAAFEIQVPRFGALGGYLECAPDAVELVAVASMGKASLRISLDLLEMLELIRSGYRPSPGDLQGKFVNLLIFRNELMNLPFDRIIATPDEVDLFEIASRPDPAVGVCLSLRKFDAFSEASQLGVSNEAP